LQKKLAIARGGVGPIGKDMSESLFELGDAFLSLGKIERDKRSQGRKGFLDVV